MDGLSSDGGGGGGLYVPITDRLIANSSFKGHNCFQKGVIKKIFWGLVITKVRVHPGVFEKFKEGKEISGMAKKMQGQRKNSIGLDKSKRLKILKYTLKDLFIHPSFYCPFP